MQSWPSDETQYHTEASPTDHPVGGEHPFRVPTVPPEFQEYAGITIPSATRHHGAHPMQFQEGRFKRQGPAVEATPVLGQHHNLSRLLYVRDFNNDLMFLVDTGAEVSVIPPPHRHSLTPSPYTLHAANNTVIKTFGQKSLQLNLNLRRQFSWIFMVADVQKPILGADFLAHFNLSVDLANPRQPNIADGHRISLQVEANEDTFCQNVSRDGGQDNGEVSYPQQAGKFQRRLDAQRQASPLHQRSSSFLQATPTTT